jgi:hypothetical protein
MAPKNIFEAIMAKEGGSAECTFLLQIRGSSYEFTSHT